MCKQIEEKIDPFVVMKKVMATVRSSGTMSEILQDILKTLVQLWGFDQLWIGIVNEEANVIEGKAGFGLNKSEISKCFSLTVDSQNPVCMAFFQKRPVVRPTDADTPKQFGRWLKNMGIRSYGYFPIFNENKVIGILGVFHYTDQIFEEDDSATLSSILDQVAIVIENAKLREEIMVAKERHKILLDSIGIGLAIIDSEQRICQTNHTFESISGYTKEVLVHGMTLNQFLSGESQNRNEMIRDMSKSPQDWEGHFVNKNGIVRQVHITVAQIANSSNRLVSLIDITKQKELERRVNRSEELASIGELSAGIAHEIRNPLVAITTSANLLKDEPQLSDEGQQLLDIVKEESDHLAVIVDDFLKYAKPKKPSFEQENINSLLQDIVRKLKDCNGREVNWVEHYDENLPGVFIDRHQIRQVITNLLLNGLDAIQEGGVLAIRTQRKKYADTDEVMVLITDSGVGIPKEELPKIFQPFYSTKEKGTGMGLAICKRIINDHDGEIFVESELGKQTTFSVVLPLQKNNVKE